MGSSNKDAFTLIEVMVAVMIVSVVIATLLQMRGNYTHIFLELDKKLKVNQYTSFFIGNKNFGFEDKTTSLDELVSEYDIEDDLRRELKNTKVELIYKELSIIDMSEFDITSKKEDVYEDDVYKETDEQPQMIFELGSSVLKTKDSSTAIMRLRLQ